MDETLFRSRYRLLHLERVAYWRGKVGRADLVETFDISGVQASADLQKYLEINPGALEYDLRRKRYFWVDGARPVLHVPDFDKAVTEFLMDDGVESRLGRGGFLRLEYPRRKAPAELRLAVFRAVVNGQVLRVRYGSVNSGGVAERRLLPTGFGHDGFRWHVRAYCFNHGEYRDFVLGRLEAILAVEEPAKKAPPPPPDAAWLETAEVRMRVNPELPPEIRKILCEDFALDEDGVLRWPVRRALEHYARDYLRTLAHPLGGAGGKMVAWFVE
jgi:hypothetical protein